MARRASLLPFLVLAIVLAGAEAFAQSTTMTSTTQMGGTLPQLSLSNILAAEVLAESAQVRWHSDHPSDSRVDYGLSTAALTLSSQMRCDNGGLVVDHCVQLNGLMPATKYYYRTVSQDEMGQTAQGGGTFTTLAAATASADTTPPAIVSGTLSVTVADGRLRAAVTLSEALEQGTVSQSTIQIKDSTGAVVSNAAGATANGVFALLPDAGHGGMSYRLVVRGLKDLAGNHMTTDFVSEAFMSPAPVIEAASVTGQSTVTTVDTIPPAVREFAFKVVSGVLQAGVVFTEAIDLSTLTDGIVFIVDSAGRRVSNAMQRGDASVYASLSGPGIAGERYRLVILHGVADRAGNRMPGEYQSPWFESPAGAAPQESAVAPNESATRILGSESTATAEPKPTVAQAQELERVGQSVRAIEQTQQGVATRVADFIEAGVERKLAPVVAFSHEERSRELERIKRAAIARGKLAAQELKNAVAEPERGMAEAEAADPVLRSSLKEIELIIRAESGVEVDLSLGSRAVTHELAKAATSIAQEREKLQERNGEDLYRDSDGDGVSDYDEQHIYKTDPHNAFTGGSLLTDGERILLGLDARSASPALVPVESPLTTGTESQYLFEVTDISFVPNADDAAEVVSRSTVETDGPSISTASSTQQAVSQDLVIAGRALPNSFVTLYIFSDPIVVTVKTDEHGAWAYTLDKTLPNGSHTLYVAMVDNGGRIVAKSKPVSFTQTAEAAAFVPLLAPAATAPGPLDAIRGYLIGAGVFAAALLFLIALVTLGMWHTGTGGQRQGTDAPEQHA
ncbi:hypothetical protein FJY94_00540 [Candidatus Kaiserbacteria bacterium]|nr:hypothetical protein [Candidatus Kaiserbacteria bacterium]